MTTGEDDLGRLIESLIDQLRGDEKAAIYAAQELILYGEQAVPYLIQALGDGDRDVRLKVIWPLWMIGDPRAVDALIAALQHDPDAKVRRHAACALGVIKAAKAIHPLISAFADSDTRVRWDSAIAVAKMGTDAIEPLVIALQYGGEQVRLGAVTAFGWMRDSRAVEWLAEALSDRDAEVRVRAVFALCWVGGESAVEPLIQALADEHDEVRMQAAAGLGWTRSQRAVEPLIALLGDDDHNDWLPYAATEALSYIGGEQAIKALAFAARYSLNIELRQAARSNLERLGLNADEITLPTNPPLWNGTRRCTLVISPITH